MKKLKNGCYFFNINHIEKFQITNPPKVWVSSFLSVDRNGISALTIMKKLKNGCHFFNINHMEKFQITDQPKFGSLVFQVSTGTEYQHQPLWKILKWLPFLQYQLYRKLSITAIMKKLKNGCHFFNTNCMETFQIINLPKVWVSGFLSVNGNEISASAIMKKLKNGCHFFNINRMEKFKITNPQTLGLQFSECQWKQNISISHYEKIEKWLPFP